LGDKSDTSCQFCHRNSDLHRREAPSRAAERGLGVTDLMVAMLPGGHAVTIDRPLPGGLPGCELA
jgi:hypothetical protein